MATLREKRPGVCVFAGVDGPRTPTPQSRVYAHAFASADQAAAAGLGQFLRGTQ